MAARHKRLANEPKTEVAGLQKNDSVNQKRAEQTAEAKGLAKALKEEKAKARKGGEPRRMTKVVTASTQRQHQASAPQISCLQQCFRSFKAKLRACKPCKWENRRPKSATYQTER
jgi:hypothetical protein